MIIAHYSILLGFSTLISQIVILREVFSQCGGNEVVYGMGLGFWLFFGGTGALLGGKGGRASWKHIDILEYAIPAFSLMSVLLIRGSRNMMGVLPGEAPSFPFIFLVSSVPLALPSLAGGMLFRKLSGIDREKGSTGKSRVFFYEAVGASIAGVVSLIPQMIQKGPFFLLSICLVGCSIPLYLSRSLGEQKPFPLYGFIATTFVALFLLLLSGRFDALSSTWSFSGFGHSYYSQTLNGRFDVTEEEEQKSYYLNLTREFVSQDPIFQEETVHLPSLFAVNPRRFLLLGAELLPLLEECEKYGEVHLSLVDGDYLHAESIIDQTGVDRFGDYYIPRDSVSYLREEKGVYDVIIASLGLPVTLSSLRILRDNFFRNVSSSLAGDGVFYVRLHFGGEYLGEDHVKILNFVNSGMKRAFRSVRIIPGGAFSFLASPSGDALQFSPEELSTILHARDLKNTYFIPEILPFLMEKEREAWANSLLSEKEHAGLLGSLPVIYGLSSVFMKHRDPADRIMVKIYHTSPEKIFAALLFCYILFYLLASIRLGSGFPQAILFFSGATGILVEVSLIFAYQMAFGSIYTHIGLLFCSYMVGLGAGSSGLTKSIRGAAICMLGGVTLALILLLWVFGERYGVPPSWLFYMALFITGVGGGALFTTAGHRCGSYSHAYALDLVGSAAAAFTGASVLIPVGGIYLTSLVILIFSVFVLSASYITLKSVR